MPHPAAESEDEPHPSSTAPQADWNTLEPFIGALNPLFAKCPGQDSNLHAIYGKGF